jgi:hypothetical protein
MSPQCPRCHKFFHAAANCEALRLLPTVKKTIAHGDAMKVSNLTSSLHALYIKSKITAGNTENANISLNSI